MMLKCYDLGGELLEDRDIVFDLVDLADCSSLIKDYIVAIRKNRRQWSASVKTKAEVKATGKKPHAQKGLGRARQGSTVSPQFRGGGVVFGPKQKFNMHISVNKKERRKANVALLSAKVSQNNMVVLAEKDFPSKTKAFYQFLKSAELINYKVLFLGKGEGANENALRLGIRNLPKVAFRPLMSVDGYQLMLADKIVLLDSAIDDFTNFVKGA